jgi:hypothetical protein
MILRLLSCYEEDKNRMMFLNCSNSSGIGTAVQQAADVEIGWFLKNGRRVPFSYALFPKTNFNFNDFSLSYPTKSTISSNETAPVQVYMFIRTNISLQV